VDRGAERTLVVSWLDTAQLKAVDDTEFPHYHRVLLPGGDFPMTMPSGERLSGAYLYASAYGVLADPLTGRPRPGGGDQAELLASLLACSARLRELFGAGPECWVHRAGTDRDLREQGTRSFAEEGPAAAVVRRSAAARRCAAPDAGGVTPRAAVPGVATPLSVAPQPAPEGPRREELPGHVGNSASGRAGRCDTAPCCPRVVSRTTADTSGPAAASGIRFWPEPSSHH
jgi:hypothetical protein